MIKLLISSSFIGLLGIVWLLLHFNNGDIATKTQNAFWIDSDVISTFKGVGFFIVGNKFGAIGFALTFTVFFLSLSKFLDAFKMYFILVSPIIILLVTAGLISLNTPIITTKNLIVIVPTAMLFGAFIFNYMYETNKKIILIYFFCILSAATWKSFTYQKPDWIGASNYIENNFTNIKCNIPIKSAKLNSGQEFLIYASYYLGNNFKYTGGPEVQESCDLIFFTRYGERGLVDEELIKHKISIPYEVLDFDKVYVVVKK